MSSGGAEDGVKGGQLVVVALQLVLGYDAGGGLGGRTGGGGVGYGR